MNDLAVWCFTLAWLLYSPPWVNIFQSSISIVEMDALSIKITSVALLIIALLKALCFVTVAMLEWWMSPWTG